ncbi:MAG: CRTAC1 family protein [Holophagales bacterium]|nr:CRTAC1 family protein [Holophagales bacterium]MYD22339.1 CRTAC1 family protein [Holophagales bacterium]MYI34121.1 CRTAC1 family protein [Holophagales bacterium]
MLAARRLHEGTTPAALFIAALAWACDGGNDTALPAADPVQPSRSAEASIFEERAAATGLDYVHRNGAEGEHYLPEIMGAGAALVDYDADGDLDVFLVQGGPVFGDGARDRANYRDRLFRNELVESGQLRFTDVTEASGLRSDGLGMGVAAGDVDGDGWVDLYVTNLGSNHLWRNRGNGGFEDVTARAGVDDPGWSVPALFFDPDGDGDLDLFVGNYLDFNRGTHTVCAAAVGGPDYCSPRSFAPQPDRFFRNLGKGRFEEATGPAGLGGADAYTLGAVALDADADHRLDLYVANDWTPNHLWLNRGDRFENGAPIAGVAVNAGGVAEAGMGVDAADFDGDGDEDLFLAHLTGETNTLYRNEGRGLFHDATLAAGLGAPSLPWTGFGAAWVDIDNDSRLDVVAVNGAVRRMAKPGGLTDFGQPNQVFLNLGDGSFEEISDQAGSAFNDDLVSRGATFGDVDNDGDTDLVVSNNGGPVQLFLNTIGQDRSWIGLRVVHGSPERDAHGAVVELRLGGGRTITRRVRTGMSYASSSDPRVLFGLAEAVTTDEMRVRWPDGVEETFDALELRRYHTLRRGEGSAP